MTDVWENPVMNVPVCIEPGLGARFLKHHITSHQNGTSEHRLASPSYPQPAIEKGKNITEGNIHHLHWYPIKECPNFYLTTSILSIYMKKTSEFHLTLSLHCNTPDIIATSPHVPRRAAAVYRTCLLAIGAMNSLLYQLKKKSIRSARSIEQMMFSLVQM
jgi:hypothetical protein